MDLDWNAMSFASRTQHLELFLGCKVENASYHGKCYSGIIRRIHPLNREILLETDKPKCGLIYIIHNYPDIFNNALIDGMTLNKFLAEVSKYSRPQISNDIPGALGTLTDLKRIVDRSAQVEEFSDWPNLTSSESSSVEILDSPDSEKDKPRDTPTSQSSSIPRSVCVPVVVRESANFRNLETTLRSKSGFNFTRSRMPGYSFMSSMSHAETDMYLVSKEGVRHSAHSFILGARLTALKEILNSGIREFSMNYSAEVVEAFLQLIYARPCPDLAKYIRELVEMFGNYGVDGGFGELSEMAEADQVKEAVTAENAAFLFFTAPMHNQLLVWADAVHVLQENYRLRESEEFRKREKEGLTLNAHGIDFFFSNVTLPEG